MPGNQDRAYYSHRAAEELERGDQAAGSTAAAVHFELAYRYAALAAQSAAGPPKLTLVNKLFVDKGRTPKKTDSLANKQVDEDVGDRDDRRIFDGWREDTQFGPPR